jgi:drug/metabolite transporter (DMT)-like permease
VPQTSAPSRATLLLIVAIAFTLVAWASAFIVIRGVVPYVSGGAMALARLVVGSLALGAIVLARRSWVRPSRRDWFAIVLYGVGWFGAYNVALNLAEATLDAGTASMIVNVAPILVAIGAGLFLGEGIPRWLAIGAGVAFLGVLIIGIGSIMLADAREPIDPAGVVWCLVAAIAFAVGVLVQKPVLRRVPSAQLTFLGCVIGMIACLPFTPQLLREIIEAPPAAIAGIVYLGIVPTALAFTTWGYALARMPAGRLGVSTYIVPPLAILMGWLAFGEVPALVAIIGGAVCLLGVALSRRSNPPKVAGLSVPVTVRTGRQP